MTTKSNSTLSLFSTCPPGLGDAGCLEATCNSTFVPPAQRVLKASSAQACTTCDAGFTGLNCNICSGIGSCAARQKASGRGLSGVETSTETGQFISSSLNHTLTCDTQPAPVTATNYQCNINQPTLSALFPGKFVLTGTNVANVPNFTTSGLSEWDAAANSSYIAVFLDGAVQFSCQATQCAVSNTTVPVGGVKAPFGTSQWSCGSFQCACVPGTKVCSNSGIPLASIINSLTGKLDLPCNYADPTDPNATTQCAFSTPMLNDLVGDTGLALDDCQFGQCLAQADLDESWLNSSIASEAAAGHKLSGSVIAGLVVLCAAVLLLLLVAIYGFLLRSRAAKRPRVPASKAIGLAWDRISYEAPTKNGRLRWARRTKGRFDDLTFTEKGELSSAVELSVLDKDLGASPSSRQHGKQILKNISSCAEPGSLTFIIGPSGSGKTTLVDILAGRVKRGRVQGALSWLSEDGYQVSALEAERQIAFVDQEDSVCLPGYLTAREALQFAATLSAPENVPKSERDAIVEDVLCTLGLQHVAHHRIGDASMRGLSGGERRRVSLGVAMVSRPKILIVDECTSGLDAVSAHRVVKALRKLASGSITGTTVIMTVHQPSSQVFHMADRTILLGSGSVIFDDAPSVALEYCAKKGKPVLPGYNVADALLGMTFKDSEQSTPAPAESTVQLASDAASVKHFGDSNRLAPESSAASISRRWKRSSLPINHGGDRPVTTFMTQLIALTQRTYVMTKRQMAGAAAHIMGTAINAIFFGACFFQVKLDLGSFQNRVGSMFSIYILILFMNLSAITVLAKTRLLMMRERASGFYSPWSWVASHLLYDLVLLRAVPGIILVTVVYWMVGLRHSVTDFFEFLLVTVIFSWAVAVYGMILAALVEDSSIAILLGALYVLFNLSFAGFIMNHAATPAAVSWLRWLAPSKYALEAVASNELDGMLLIDNIKGVPIRLQVSLFTQKLFGFAPDSYYRDLIVLSCGFLLGHSVVLFLAVWWGMRELR